MELDFIEAMSSVSSYISIHQGWGEMISEMAVLQLQGQTGWRGEFWNFTVRCYWKGFIAYSKMVDWYFLL